MADGIRPKISTQGQIIRHNSEDSQNGNASSGKLLKTNSTLVPSTDQKKTDEHLRTRVLGSETSVNGKFKNLQDDYKLKKTTLDSNKREVFILGGLKRDVSCLETLVKSQKVSSNLEELRSIHEKILKDIDDELEILHCNADLETDEFASAEVAAVSTLISTLQSVDSELFKFNSPNKDKFEGYQASLAQLTSKYSADPNTVSFTFDEIKPEHLARMDSKLSTSDEMGGKKFKVFGSEETLSYADFKSNLYTQFQANLDSIIQSTQERGERQDTAIALVRPDGTVHTSFRGTGINENTKFRIGSMSKFFTSILAKTLEGSNPNIFDTKLSDKFSDEEITLIFGEENLERDKNITLQQLMDQTTGIRGQDKPDENYNLDKSQGSLRTTDELLQACEAGLKLGGETKDAKRVDVGTFQYSNYNATLAGALLERICDNTPFKSLMQTHVFSPMGMSSSTYDVPSESERAKSYDKKEAMLQEGDYSNSTFFDPSSHIWTSLTDLQSFFSQLKTDPKLTAHMASKGDGFGYSSFAKINTTGGQKDKSVTIGVDGGRDGFGSSAHMGPDGIVIAIGNGGAGDMDALTGQMARLLTHTSPFSGDPTTAGL